MRRPPRSPLFPYTTLSRPVVDDQITPAAAVLLGPDDQVARDRRVPGVLGLGQPPLVAGLQITGPDIDRKSTRLNSSHANISYAVFCLKKKQKKQPQQSPTT